jgi:hypothetical protein
LVYLVVSAAAALVLSEGAVRALGLAPRLPAQDANYVTDPVLPHKPKPGSVLVGRSTTGEFDFRYEHNVQGWRDREVALEKPPGRFRILGLGDSFTYGAGASFENTYLSRLERTLNARDGGHPPVEVLKAGIPRFFPETERLLLEHYGLRFSPDLVLVGFVPNDVFDTHLGIEAIRVLPDGRLVSNYGARLLEQLGPGMLLLYRHWHALRIPVRRYLETQVERDKPLHPEELFQDAGAHEDDWQEIERQYTAMVELLRPSGAPLVVVHLPQLGLQEPGVDYPARRLSAWAQRTPGAHFVDTLPALREHAGSARLYWPEDGHPTDAGHEVFAEVLRDALVERGLVP